MPRIACKHHRIAPRKRGAESHSLGRELQPLQIRDCLGCLGSRRKDGATVVLHQLEPLGEVLRMIGACVLRDAKFAAQES